VATQQLTWRDAAIAWLVAWVGAFLLAAALIPITRRGPLPTLPAYAAHAWLFAVAMFWFFVLRRKFPVGTVRWRELRPWAWSWLVPVALLLAAAPFIHGGLRQPWPLMAQSLLLPLVLVGPTEEFISRGVVQIGLNNSIAWTLRIRGLSVKGGTLISSVMFGLAHLVNLVAHPLGDVLPQVGGAAAIGLAIGLLYDRYPNLWGASILHNLIDGLQAVIRYL
jgi:membrane protease YdiL (CAAX protease family)